MTIADTSGQDIQIAPKSSRRRWIIVGATSLAILAVAALFIPAMARWLRAEASVPRERLRLATVSHGDLVRDVSVEGRVVAAVSPTLFAAADGTITLLVESGAEVAIGDELARVESPELQNQLEQEQATLESQRVELERQRITTRQLQLESQKNVDLAAVALTAARRERRRAELAFETRAIPEIDVEKAADDLDNAELSHEHAVKDMELDRERLNFELRTRELQVQRQDLLVRDLQRRVE
jgi:HlyD family secretion protein